MRKAITEVPTAVKNTKAVTVANGWNRIRRVTKTKGRISSANVKLMRN